METILLFSHSWLRWVILFLAVLVLIKSLMAWLGKQDYKPMDDKLSLFFSISLDIQLLIGLLQYFKFSALAQAARSNMAEAMKNAELRFWAVEHITGMILAIALVHIGRVLIKKATTSEQKHKRTLIWFGTALLIMLLSIPWPGNHPGVALFRF